MSRRQVSEEEIRTFVLSELSKYRPGGAAISPEKTEAILGKALEMIQQEMLSEDSDAYVHASLGLLPDLVMGQFKDLVETAEWQKWLRFGIDNLPSAWTSGDIYDGALRRLLQHQFRRPERPITPASVQMAIGYSIRDFRRRQRQETQRAKTEYERQSANQRLAQEPGEEDLMPESPLLGELLDLHARIVQPDLLRLTKQLGKRDAFLTGYYLRLHWLLLLDPIRRKELSSPQAVRTEASGLLLKKILGAKPGEFPEIDNLAEALRQLPDEPTQRTKLRKEKDKAFQRLNKLLDLDRKPDGARRVSKEDFARCKAIVPWLALGLPAQAEPNDPTPETIVRPPKAKAPKKSARFLRMPVLAGSIGAIGVVIVAWWLFNDLVSSRVQEAKLGRKDPGVPKIQVGDGPAEQKKIPGDPKIGPLAVGFPAEVNVRLQNLVAKPALVAVLKPAKVGLIELGAAKGDPFPKENDPGKPPLIMAKEKPLPRRPLRILAPLYVNPASSLPWRTLAADHGVNSEMVVVVNPNSGPGLQAEPNYVGEVFRAIPEDLVRRKVPVKLRMLGYIAVQYGQKPIKNVRNEIQRWWKFYPQIDGVFVDEMPSADSELPYAEILADMVRSMKGPKNKAFPLVFLNPGVVCSEKYFDVADNICVFENRASELGRIGASVKEFAHKYPGKMSALVHTCLPEETSWEKVADHLIKHGIHTFYITDAAGKGHPRQESPAAPWHRLPAHWPGLVNAVRNGNRAALP